VFYMSVTCQTADSQTFAHMKNDDLRALLGHTSDIVLIFLRYEGKRSVSITDMSFGKIVFLLRVQFSNTGSLSVLIIIKFRASLSPKDVHKAYRGQKIRFGLKLKLVFC
jgi:hypothetical protein